MTNAKNGRAGVVWAGVLWTLMIGLAGYGLWAVQQAAPAADQPAPVEERVTDAAPVAEEAPAECNPDVEAADEAGKPCRDCPRRLPGRQCTRLSCDPCCYACVGEPLPICSS